MLSIIYIKYLIENNQKSSAIVVIGIIIFVVFLMNASDTKFVIGYKDFEKKEVSLWDKLTLKRTVKFMVKYHLYLMYNIIDEILDLIYII